MFKKIGINLDWNKEIKLSAVRHYLSALLIVSLICFVYANSLSGKFIWDDQALVRDNSSIKSWSNLGHIITGYCGQDAGVVSNFYRPLTNISYLIDYSLWQLNPAGYHISNILLHSAVAISLYWLVNLLFSDLLLGLLTALLFAIHPVHTEAVSYIAGRADSLAGLFVLLSFVFYFKSLHIKNLPYYFTTILFYILSLLSRENAVIFPGLLLAYHYIFSIKINLKRFAPFVVIGLTYLILRIIFLPGVMHNGTLFTRLPGFFAAFLSYIRILLLPLNLHMEYGNQLFTFNQPQVFLGIILFFLLAAYVILARANKILLFFSLWFLIMLIPNSNLFPINAYMAEHWLYLPSIGFFIILASGLLAIYRNWRYRNMGLVFIGVLISFYSILTIKQNKYWQDPIYFYKKTLQYSPNSIRLRIMLGREYLDKNDINSAVNCFKEALTIQPNASAIFTELGFAYGVTGYYDEAAKMFREAIKFEPKNPANYTNLAAPLFYSKNYDEAIRACQQALEISPKDVQAYTTLIGACYNSKQCDLAREYFIKAKHYGCSLVPALEKLVTNCGN